MTTKQDENTGLFIASYLIGRNMPGAMTFTIGLSVSTLEKRVSGMGRISQAVNPPLNVATTLNGDFTYMCVMPRTCHILITATGVPVIHWPQNGGIGPVLPPNVELRMVLTDDWQTGTANYKYIDSDGKWHEIPDATVTIIPSKEMVGKE